MENILFCFVFVKSDIYLSIVVISVTVRNIQLYYIIHLFPSTFSIFVGMSNVQDVSAVDCTSVFRRSLVCSFLFGVKRYKNEHVIKVNCIFPFQLD
jgi:hypothetical protein